MKNTLRKILWLITTLLVSLLFIYLFSFFKKYFPYNSFLFAFELHFILMSWYAFSIPYLNLEYKSSYYNIKLIEKAGEVYTYFGVTFFIYFLKFIGWNKISDKANGNIIKDLNRLKQREKHTREAEFAHAILFIHFIIIALCFLPNYNVFWLLVLNIVLHIYPIFVQRYNRPRYLKIIAKLEGQNKNVK